MSLFLIVCYLSFASSAPAVSSGIEIECIDCVSQIGHSFMKTLWWPISEPEFSCVNNLEFEEYVRGIIIGVACSRLTCKDILKMIPDKIYNNKTSPCSLDQELDGENIFWMLIDSAELILLGLLLLAWLLNGKTMQDLANLFDCLNQALFYRGLQ